MAATQSSSDAGAPLRAILTDDQHEYWRGDVRYTSVSEHLDRVHGEFDRERVVSLWTATRRRTNKNATEDETREMLRQRGDYSRELGKEVHGAIYSELTDDAKRHLSWTNPIFSRDARKCLRQFSEFDHVHLVGEYRFVAAEQSVYIDDGPHHVAGTFDALFVDADGVYMLVDWKVKKRITPEESRRIFDQLHAYAVMLRLDVPARLMYVQMHPERSRPNVRSMAYDPTRTPVWRKPSYVDPDSVTVNLDT